MEQNRLVELLEAAEIKLVKAQKRVAKYGSGLTEEQKMVAMLGWKQIKEANYGWEIDNKVSDYRRATFSLTDAEKLVNKYKEAVVKVEVESKMERIEVLDLFLAGWKQKAKKFYLEDARRWHELRKEISDKYTTNGIVNRETLTEYREATKKLNNFDSLTIMICGWNGKIDTELLNKELDKEVKRKYNNLVKRIEKKAGKIIDVNGLRVSENAEINGTVYGDKGWVAVETIMAGGYNIQCLHFRVLVKPIKVQ